MAYKFELLKQLDDDTNEIKEYINLTEENINNEKINSKEVLINQLLGHFKQLLMRVQEILDENTFQEYLDFQENISHSISNMTNISNILIKLKELDNIYSQLETKYHNLIEECNNNLGNRDILKYNELISEINDNIKRINELSIDKNTLDDLESEYNKLKEHYNLDKLNIFLKNITILINNYSNDINSKMGSTIRRNFSLFAKINDQIVTSSFYNKDNLVYACYTLEDNSKYYAIIKDINEIKILDQSFCDLPNLVLTKDKIIEICRIIIKNLGIYYNINEYMRYIEKSYKNKMTKEIDELIATYKNRLVVLENKLNNQLSFIDEIALLVNDKPSKKYPNIKYNDVSLKEFFIDEIDDTKETKIREIITNIFLNSNIKSKIDTNTILSTLYNNIIIISLDKLNYKNINNNPSLDNDLIGFTINNDSKKDFLTNNDKIKNYLDTRLREFNLLKDSPKINVTLTRDTNLLFKDINTIFDIHTAVIICDKVYKEGQGIYALTDFINTSNITKFTSKYNARNIVSSIDKNYYLKLLMENIFMQYIYFIKNNITNTLTSTLNNYITKELNIINNNIIFDDNIISIFFKYYDYNLLDKSSSKYLEIDKLIKESNINLNDKINLFINS